MNTLELLMTIRDMLAEGKTAMEVNQYLMECGALDNIAVAGGSEGSAYTVTLAVPTLEGVELPVSEDETLAEVREMLSQLHVCGHGTRGWCPNCAVLVQDGHFPPGGQF